MLAYVEPRDGTAFEADSLVATCIEGRARALLLDGSAAPPEFFDLSTRLAGELLHGLSKYSLRLAVVVPDISAHSRAFQDFARESNRGHLARFFANRDAAVAWLGIPA